MELDLWIPRYKLALEYQGTTAFAFIFAFAFFRLSPSPSSFCSALTFFTFFRHLCLSPSSLSLFISFQGEQHYHDIHAAFGPSGTMALYSERDLKKKKACAENGITLVIIPYWCVTGEGKVKGEGVNGEG